MDYEYNRPRNIRRPSAHPATAGTAASLFSGFPPCGPSAPIAFTKHACYRAFLHRTAKRSFFVFYISPSCPSWFRISLLHFRSPATPVPFRGHLQGVRTAHINAKSTIRDIRHQSALRCRRSGGPERRRCGCGRREARSRREARIARRIGTSPRKRSRIGVGRWH